MSRSKRIAEQLGMSHGAATHHLRKKILFNFLTRLHENVCFVCSKTIETVKELSIEHKKPWEGRSAELFWDLDNIAFSHMKCNKPHKFSEGNTEYLLKHPYNTKTKDAPEGKAWCSGHKGYVVTDNFHSNQRNVNGVASYYKECRKVRLD